MSTILKFGPKDHGRPVTEEEIAEARWQEGYSYEIIDGRLYVSPVPNLPQDRIRTWVFKLLDTYASHRPEVINYVTAAGRVFVPGRPGLTAPEPDVTAYQDFPLDLPIRDVRWEDVSPLLGVEIVSADDPTKDFERNVELYRQVPSLREYWVFDPRTNPDEPTLYVYRRRGTRWQARIEIAFGDVYTTRLLPDFTITVDPHT